MNKIYKCAKNCGNIVEVKERDDDGSIPLCCSIEMIEVKNDDNGGSLGCFGCMGCYGETDDAEDDK